MHISKPSCRTRIQGLGGIEDVNMFILFILEENVTTTHLCLPEMRTIDIWTSETLDLYQKPEVCALIMKKVFINLFININGGDV